MTVKLVALAVRDHLREVVIEVRVGNVNLEVWTEGLAMMVLLVTSIAGLAVKAPLGKMPIVAPVEMVDHRGSDAAPAATDLRHLLRIEGEIMMGHLTTLIVVPAVKDLLVKERIMAPVEMVDPRSLDAAPAATDLRHLLRIEGEIMMGRLTTLIVVPAVKDLLVKDLLVKDLLVKDLLVKERIMARVEVVAPRSLDAAPVATVLRHVLRIEGEIMMGHLTTLIVVPAVKDLLVKERIMAPVEVVAPRSLDAAPAATDLRHTLRIAVAIMMGRHTTLIVVPAVKDLLEKKPIVVPVEVVGQRSLDAVPAATDLRHTLRIAVAIMMGRHTTLIAVPAATVHRLVSPMVGVIMRDRHTTSIMARAVKGLLREVLIVAPVVTLHVQTLNEDHVTKGLQPQSMITDLVEKVDLVILTAAPGLMGHAENGKFVVHVVTDLPVDMIEVRVPMGLHRVRMSHRVTTDHEVMPRSSLRNPTS